MPSLATSPLPVALAQATVASRSDITCLSGTLETTLEKISWKFCDLRHVSLARIKFRSDGQVAQLGQAAADILDMLVDAEDLLYDQDHGKRSPVVGQGPIGGNLAVADRDLHLAGHEPFGVRRDRLGGNGLRRQRKSGRQ